MTAAALCAYIEGLELVGGERDSQQFTILPWERRFLAGAFREVHDSALSLGRGNGKSALCAAVACAVIDPKGPLHSRRAEVTVVASSFAQGRIIFADAVSMMSQRYNLEVRKHWRKADSQNAATLEHRGSGATLRTIGSDPKRAHGLRPKLALLDEPAQWPASTSDEMRAVVSGGLGKVAGSRLIALGTRPARRDHWFQVMLDGGAGYSQVHTARPDDAPFHRRTWKRANPSLDHLPELERRIRLEADGARRDPALLQAFRSARLNEGISDTLENLLLSQETWEAIEGDADAGGGYVMGVDLGSGEAMSAVAAYWPRSYRLEALAAFPAEPTLTERGLADGVGGLYGRMHEREELIISGRAMVQVPELLAEALRRWGRPRVIVCDTWRRSDLIEALTAAEFPRAGLVTRRQGYFDGADDLRRFRRAALDDQLRPAESLVLRAAMAEARTVSDSAGNTKLSKGGEGGRRRRAKDDALAASILAVAEGRRRADRQARTSAAYLGVV